MKPTTRQDEFAARVANTAINQLSPEVKTRFGVDEFGDITISIYLEFGAQIRVSPECIWFSERGHNTDAMLGSDLATCLKEQILHYASTVCLKGKTQPTGTAHNAPETAGLLKCWAAKGVQP